MTATPTPSLRVWGKDVPLHALAESERLYLSSLPPLRPSLDWVWSEIDRVWHELGLDNTAPLDNQSVSDFYSHPVWLMNGIFTAQDPESKVHRLAIAAAVCAFRPTSVADVGGGSGVLARMIAEKCAGAQVDLIEPWPSALTQEEVTRDSRVRLVPDLSAGGYDVIVAQDVLEHVDDPVGLTHKWVRRTRMGGHCILASNFHPVIQCHLPATFHLRFTFRVVAWFLGLTLVGVVAGAPHAEIYVRRRRPYARLARVVERGSSVVEPILASVQQLVQRNGRP